MKTKYLLFIILFLSAFQKSSAQSQAVYDRQETAGKIIDVQLQSFYGHSYYGAWYVYEVDSYLGSDKYFSPPLEDPFGTLKGCFIFVGFRDKNLKNDAVVGIYKDGNILWRSDILNCYANLDLFITIDLNNDGTVELCFQSGNDETDLWIFSWDGYTGKRINAVDGEGASILKGYDYRGSGSFGLIDVEGDGIWEIKIYNYNEGEPNGYSWNGQEYGYWATTPNTKITFPPRNKIDIIVNCQAKKQLDTLQYEYKIYNRPTSKQRVKDFLLWSDAKEIIGLSSPAYWGFSEKSGQGFGWIASTKGYIYIGKSLNGFSAKSKGLCGILAFHSHGYNSLGNWDELTDTLAQLINDQLKNAFWGKTIGPADPPNPFIPLNFLDTLTSYTTQSRSLEWIKDQQTADKYLGYFNSAKTSLQQNNTASARATLNQVLQDANIDSTFNITSEAYALIRYNTEYLLSQLPTTPPPSGCNVKLVNSTGAKLTGGTLQYYEGSWKEATNNNDGTFFINTTKTSLSLRMTYEYGTQTKSNVSISSDTIVFQTVNAQIQLQNSSGELIDTGTVKYYAGAWRDLGTTVNGIATKELLAANYSFRITYAYANKDKQQDLNTNPIVIFQTVNASVQLQNSQGNLIDQGTVQYYAGTWREFGTTSNGVANKELLPNNYSFRMTYAYAGKDKQQDLSTNPTVVFQTVNAAVQLQNSQGNLIDQGTVQYYSGAWREFGTTSNGVANKELLPNNYSFRMTYAYASKDKQQDLNTNPTVVFQTVNAKVQLQNSNGVLIDTGTVKYYAGAWRDLGTTVNGTASKEILPNNYSFRMTYENASIDKKQDLSTNNIVVFSTVLCTIRVKNAQNEQIDGATASYYSGTWRQIGLTVNGEITKELLPLNLSFRVKMGTKQQDKKQDLSANTVVEFTL